jgi:hypothetical protein
MYPSIIERFKGCRRILETFAWFSRGARMEFMLDRINSGAGFLNGLTRSRSTAGKSTL